MSITPTVGPSGFIVGPTYWLSPRTKIQVHNPGGADIIGVIESVGPKNYKVLAENGGIWGVPRTMRITVLQENMPASEQNRPATADLGLLTEVIVSGAPDQAVLRGVITKVNPKNYVVAVKGPDRVREYNVSRLSSGITVVE